MGSHLASLPGSSCWDAHTVTSARPPGRSTRASSASSRTRRAALDMWCSTAMHTTASTAPAPMSKQMDAENINCTKSHNLLTVYSQSLLLLKCYIFYFIQSRVQG